MDIKLPELTGQQAKFVATQQRYKLYGGAMGGGKTFALCVHAILLSLDFPGNVGLVCREDMADLSPTTYKTFVDMCLNELGGIPGPIIKQHHQTENWIEFKNGSRVYFRGLKDVGSLGSWNLGWFAMDEATECTEDQFNMLESRLRLVVPGIRYFGLLASNPGLGWVYKRFIENPGQDYAFIPALPRDNPHLPADYEGRLREKWPESWVKRYLDGEWLTVEGPVIPEFDQGTQVVSPFELPSFWPRYRGMDYGQSAPTAVLWAAMSPHSEVFVYREYYEGGLTIKQHSERIAALNGPERIQFTAGDPRMASKTLEQGNQFYSPLADFAQNGLIIAPSNNDTLASIARIRELCAVDYSRVNPLTLTRPSPRLFIFSNVIHLPEQLAIWKWKPELRRGLEVPAEDKEDHSRDAFRYLTMMLPTVAGAEQYSKPLDRMVNRTREERNRRYAS